MERAMENTPIPKYTISFGLSLALACVVNALLVVAKEKIPSVMAGMQKLTGHHWVSHCAIVLLLFALFGWLFARANGGRGINLTLNRFLATLVSGVALGGLLIFAFYLIGD
jgi:ribose/xylose/arabinose/galactoside ABC-type transport system permease subunit